MRQGWVLYDLCLLLCLERVTGMELNGFVAQIYGPDIYRDGYESVAWESQATLSYHPCKLMPQIH